MYGILEAEQSLTLLVAFLVALPTGQTSRNRPGRSSPSPRSGNHTVIGDGSKVGAGVPYHPFRVRRPRLRLFLGALFDTDTGAVLDSPDPVSGMPVAFIAECMQFR